MLNQVLEVIGLRENEEQQLEELYDNFQRPPNLEIAMKHAAAMKFAKTDPNIDLDKTNVCPCCGLPTIIEELPLCSDRNEFSFNGSGVALYFDFLVFSALTVFTYLVISGGYDFYKIRQNMDCNNDSSLSTVSCNFYNQFSIINTSNELDWVQSLLNLVSLCVILMESLFYTRHINKIAQELDDAAILASDFSIFVQNIPRDAKEQEIREFFSKKFKNEEVDMKKLCIAYEIQPYLKLDKQKQLKESILTKVLELEAAGKSLPKSIPSKLNLQEEIKKISYELDYMEDHRATIFEFSGVCVISYNYEKQADYVCGTYKATRFQLFLEQLGFNQDKYEKFRENSLFVRKAPEPGDIVWGNLGITVKEQVKRFLITYIMTTLLLILGFGCLVGIQYCQTLINKYANSDSQQASEITELIIQILGVVASLLISIINGILAKLIIKFAELEQHATKTDYDVSVAQKMGLAQFLNTAILTLIINLFIKNQSEDYLNSIIQSAGLNQNVTLIFITNSIVPWLTNLFDFNYFYKLYVRSKIIKQGQDCKYTQNEANKAFEGPSIDLSQKYASLSKTLMFTFVYASLLPLGVALTCCSLFCIYWTEKFLLLKRDSKPAPTGSAMAEAMVSFYIKLVLLLFSLGTVFWEWILWRQVHLLTWISLGISGVYYFAPISSICGCIVDLGVDNATVESYEEKYLTFYDDYDRKNPVTADAAKENWIKVQQETIQTPQLPTSSQKLTIKQSPIKQHLKMSTYGSTKIHPDNQEDEVQELQM